MLILLFCCRLKFTGASVDVLSCVNFGAYELC